VNKGLALVIIYFVCTSVLGQAPIKFLPTEFSSINPYQFEINRNTVSLQMPLCSASQYVGCTALVGFNLPFTGWSLDDGTYLNFTVMSDGDACGTVLCRNDPTSPTVPGTCSFVIKSNIGARIFVSGVSGRAAGFQATFNMKISCPVQPLLDDSALKRETRENSGLAQCPQQADPTKRFVSLVTPGTAPTSPKTTDALKYAVAICPDQKAMASLSYNCQAVDQKSAMATYFCPAVNCNTNTAPQGWFDQSGTALNFVQINSLSSQILYFTIYGWGEFQDKNTFVFNLQINDQ